MVSYSWAPSVNGYVPVHYVRIGGREDGRSIHRDFQMDGIMIACVTALN